MYPRAPAWMACFTCSSLDSVVIITTGTPGARFCAAIWRTNSSPSMRHVDSERIRSTFCGSQYLQPFRAAAGLVHHQGIQARLAQCSAPRSCASPRNRRRSGLSLRSCRLPSAVSLSAQARLEPCGESRSSSSRSWGSRGASRSAQITSWTESDFGIGPDCGRSTSAATGNRAPAPGATSTGRTRSTRRARARDQSGLRCCLQQFHRRKRASQHALRAPDGTAIPAPARSPRADRSCVPGPAPAPGQAGPQIPDRPACPPATRRGSAPNASKKARQQRRQRLGIMKFERQHGAAPLQAQGPGHQAARLTPCGHQPLAQPSRRRLPSAPQAPPRSCSAVIQPCSSMSKPSGTRWRCCRPRRCSRALQFAAQRPPASARRCSRPNRSSRLQIPAPSGCATDAAIRSRSAGLAQASRSPGTEPGWRLPRVVEAARTAMSTPRAHPRCPVRRAGSSLKRGIVYSPGACAALPPR